MRRMITAMWFRRPRPSIETAAEIFIIIVVNIILVGTLWSVFQIVGW